jgi:hypothetical protein
VNVFAIDHPLSTPPPPQFVRRLRRWFRIGAIIYPVYLLLLGPYWTIEGRGSLNFIPNSMRQVVNLPSVPIWLIPHVRGRYADYLDWWYLDPNAADHETGWD